MICLGVPLLGVLKTQYHIFYCMTKLPALFIGVREVIGLH
jgi:hypothetical protein